MATPPRRAAPEAISIQVAAAVLCVSEQTVRRKIKSGELEAVKFGKLWRIPRDVLARVRRDGLVPSRPRPLPQVQDPFVRHVAALVAVMLAEERDRDAVVQVSSPSHI